MDATGAAVAASLALLTVALAWLTTRAFVRFFRGHERTQIMWGTGMGMASAAMGIETAVYAGFCSSPLLEGYVFVSAALVGLLSLGCVHVIRARWFARIYTGYILFSCAVLGVVSFSTPVPLSLVSGGIISGAPPTFLLVVSSFITGPATIVLLLASAVSLRRSRRWQTVMIIAGALVLGAGGTLYIAAFPVFLYYAEFIGIVLLFGGVVSLPKPVGTSMAIRRSAGMAE